MLGTRGFLPVRLARGENRRRTCHQAFMNPIRVEPHTGPRDELRSLFELAEDSAAALDGYIGDGRVLIATEGHRVVGHLQLTETASASEAEVKNMAVVESHQGQGIGRALIEAVLDLAREERRSSLIVATAAADIGNLRFYQRMGFRLRSIERDAFTEATGCAPGLEIDGIELRDRVWLDRRVADQFQAPVAGNGAGDAVLQA